MPLTGVAGVVGQRGRTSHCGGLGIAVEEAGDRRGVGGERGPVDDVLVAGGDGEDGLADGEGSVDVDDRAVGQAGAYGERDDVVGADRRGGGGGGGLGEGEGIAGEGSGGGGGEGGVSRRRRAGVGRGDGEGGLSDGEGAGNEGGCSSRKPACRSQRRRSG